MNIAPTTQTYSIKSKQQSFKGEENTQNFQRFQVNKPLEYAGAISSSVAGGGLTGAIAGFMVGAIKSDALINSMETVGKNSLKSIKKPTLIGAAIGAAFSLMMLPFTLNRTRERIYQKQLNFDVMSNVANKAKNGQLEVNEASEYLKTTALNNLAVATAYSGNTNTAGLMAGSYIAGNAVGSSSASKK